MEEKGVDMEVGEGVGEEAGEEGKTPRTSKDTGLPTQEEVDWHTSRIVHGVLHILSEGPPPSERWGRRRGSQGLSSILRVWDQRASEIQ